MKSKNYIVAFLDFEIQDLSSFLNYFMSLCIIILFSEQPFQFPCIITHVNFPSIFTRLHKHASQSFNEQGFGDQFRHLLVVTKSLWACSCSLQLHSSPGSLLCLNSRLVCCSTKHSVEVCKFLAFLVAIGRIALQGTRSDLSTTLAVSHWLVKNLLICLLTIVLVDE